jgi:hypothetical protein
MGINLKNRRPLPVPENFGGLLILWMERQITRTGILSFVFSIALEKEGKDHFGCNLRPDERGMFVAAQGKGFNLNNKKLVVSKTHDLSKSLWQPVSLMTFAKAKKTILIISI